MVQIHIGTEFFDLIFTCFKYTYFVLNFKISFTILPLSNVLYLKTAFIFLSEVYKKNVLKKQDYNYFVKLLNNGKEGY